MNPAAVRTALLVVGIFITGCGGDDAKAPTMIPVSACTETFTACGGNEVGTWSLTSVCANGSIADLFNVVLSTDYPSCGQSFTDVRMSSTGTVTYDGTKYTRAGSVQTNSKMKITSACVAEQMLGLVLTANSCNSLAKVLPSMYPGTTFNCTYDGTTCNCDTNSVDSINASGTYVKSGTSITESVDQVNYRYCVNGNDMSQLGILASSEKAQNTVEGITHLTKQ